MECQTNARSFREPWNKSKLVGQKARKRVGVAPSGAVNITFGA